MLATSAPASRAISIAVSKNDAIYSPEPNNPRPAYVSDFEDVLNVALVEKQIRLARPRNANHVHVKVLHRPGVFLIIEQTDTHGLLPRYKVLPVFDLTERRLGCLLLRTCAFRC